MGSSLTPAPLAAVRAAIAGAVCERGELPVAIGGVTLVAAQQECVRRARASVAQYGGVLIASDVGSGKTYVALTIAREYERPVVFAPAGLRGMWSAAMARTHLTMPFISLESLGRGREPPAGCDLVIVDEAHHVRNPFTKSYHAVRRTTRGAHVALLSATPLHNRAADLHALLALFLADDPRDLDDDARARMIVRNAEPAAGPRVTVHPRVALPEPAVVTDRIKALPPPIAVRDGAVALTLMRLSLMRAWCSSAGALSAMLRRASLRAAALADAIRAGRNPTRAELKAFSDDGQLAFAELIATGVASDARALQTLDAHLGALSSLRELVRRHAALDDERARRLAAIADAHPGIAVLACTQYAATVEAYWSRLRVRAGVAAVTSKGARIVSGPIGRDEALARFAPVAQGARAPHDRERINMLIATDLVSEGVNLHDAGVVVHLDLPWTAARLAQRVGRIARMGSPHSCVHAYEIAPPNAAAEALALTSRLRRKRGVAARLIGGDRRFAELLGDAPAPESAAEARARALRTFAPFAEHARPADFCACVIDARASGWLALVGGIGPLHSGGLVARIAGAAPTTNPRTIATIAEWIATGTERAFDLVRARQAERELHRWLDVQRARHLAGTSRRHAARAQGRSLASTIASVSAAPAHERASAAAAAAARMPGALPSAPGSLHALVVFCADGNTARRPPL